MTAPTLADLFDSVGESAFRFEGLDAYAVGGAEAERIEAWRHHQPRPVRSIRTNDYLARIARHALLPTPIPWERVTRRAVPPTEYHRYRVAGDVESQAAGEIVSVLLPGALDVPPGGVDFWLFDRGLPVPQRRAALMRYTADGAYVGFDLVDGEREPDVIAGLSQWAAHLVEAAIPLNSYLATLDAGTEQIGA